MTPELEKKLYDTYPKIFRQKDLSEMETCMVWGIETGVGWFDLIDRLCMCIQEHIDWKVQTHQEVRQLEATQVKSKFGGLRFYTDGGDDFTDGMIRLAEALSYKICENCGKPGSEFNDHGWYSTLCEECKHVEAH